MLFAIFLSIVAISNAASPCHFPAQWCGGADNERYVRGGGFDTFEIAYDATGQRFSANCTLNVGTELERNVIVMALYAKKSYYIISLKKEECAVINLDDPFKPWGVPEGSTNINEFYFGAATESLKINDFVKEIEIENRTLYLNIEVTEELCVPVIEGLSGKDEEGKLIEINNVFYYDIKPTVDSRFFIPPSFCTRAVMLKVDDEEVKEIKERLSFSRAMKLF
eukprot:m.309907 g.309907  ORF g.309907 m.309907 type:complete len:223 (+) comp48505_c0_seq1:46-714(+)